MANLIFTVLTLLCTQFIFNEGNQLCSLCNCPKSYEANPYTVNCEKKALDLMPDWDVSFGPASSQVNNLHLNIDYNNFKELKKFSTHTLFGITYMSFEHNNIAFIEPQAFEFLTNMKYLSLAGNNLSTLHPDTFRTSLNNNNLPIVTLDLSNNHIHHLDDDIFQDLHILTELRLNNNPLVAFDASTMTALNGLWLLGILDLSSTGLSDLPEQLVNPISHLDRLYLANNQFTTVPKILEKGIHLVELVLDGNPIGTFDSNSFKGLVKLSNLNISNMDELTEIGAHSFGHFRQLSVLTCNHNRKLEFLHPLAFLDYQSVPIPDVKVVEIQYSNISFIDKMVFDKLKIKDLDLRYNPFNCTCNLVWMHHYNFSKKYAENIRCHTPPELHEMPIKNVDFQTVPCASKLLYETLEFEEEHQKIAEKTSPYIGIISGLVVICIISVITTVVILRRRRIMRHFGNNKHSMLYSRADMNE